MARTGRRGNAAFIKSEPNQGVTRSAIPTNGLPTASDGVSEMGESNRRGMRSGAPSIATRLPSIVAHDDNMDVDLQEEDECVLMQVRPKWEHEHSQDMTVPTASSQNLQGSFIGPNQALKDFGQRLKDINDALGELQARGIQHVANLPELVLVGDQSSGKSSLMSAIAGLSLPRSSGACTRCPIHIRISRAEEWSVRVSLEQHYEFRPRDHPITLRDVTERDRFPPWVKLPQQTRHEFKTVREPFGAEDIETILRCAQVAILNPSTPYRMFIPKLNGEVTEDARTQHMERIREKEQHGEAQFSPNTVALEIKGPDLADLNFYDLPGVFINAKRPEDRFLERVVRNLTCEYISRRNAIILWAVPMNQDAETSYAFNLIQELRAQQRCIGVMTKADLLPKEDEAASSWLSMLNEQAHRTGLGYFITSRQGGDDLDEQNKLEEAFFNRTADSTGQWPEEFEAFKDRCGVEKLKSFLSLKLGEEFSKVLPEVKEKVNNRLHAIALQLKKYPDPPPNPEMEVIKSLTEFSGKVKDRVLQQDFMSQWDNNYAEPFKKRIIAMKPKFIVKEPVIITLDLDSPSSTPTQRKRNLPEDTQATPSKRGRGLPANGANGAVKLEPQDRLGVSTPSSRLGFQNQGLTTPMSSPSRGPRSKTLMELRQIIQRSAVPGQPGLVSASVYEPLYTEAAMTWGGHLQTFISETFMFLENEIMYILEGAFFHLKNRAVYRESVEHMKAFMESHKKELTDQLNLIYNLEAHRLFTKDEDALERNKAAEKKVLQRHRHLLRWSARMGESIGPIRKMEELTEEELAQENIRMQKELVKLGPDPFEPEVNVAAYVRGYYLTAASRFIDVACIHVMSGLLPRIARVIDTYLYEKLGFGGQYSTREETLNRLMEEGPETARKRNELRVEKERLDQAMEIIINLEHREQTPVQNGSHSSATYPMHGANLNGTYAHSLTSATERRPSIAPTDIGEA